MTVSVPPLASPAVAMPLPPPRPELQRATSTTSGNDPPLNGSSGGGGGVGKSILATDPAEWSVDDVMRYLASIDSALSVHSQLFQKHVSAFLLCLVGMLSDCEPVQKAKTD